ncbi:MAG TPA: hypothetical protein VHE78_05125 [Gemmatimonadaceae bacterium]|nr:hypothetical protein [Gemmatimonadaceae bacterium]
MPTIPRSRAPSALPEPDQETLHHRAADNLRFIRDTMARAGPFTSVSGVGTMGAGAIGLIAAITSTLVPRDERPAAWTGVWLAAALAAGCLSWAAIWRKAARAGQSLSAGPARRFALAFLPAIVAGGVLTATFVTRGLAPLLPGMWLTVYGAAITAAGAYSVRPVPVMGCAFLALGAACFAVSPHLQLLFLAAGFGGLHLTFGFLIARQYGG